MRTTPYDAVLTCDLGALTAPDLALVDALARLRLAAARHRVGVVLLNASGPLRELLVFSGLAALFPGPDGPLAADPLTGTPIDDDPMADDPIDDDPLDDAALVELLGRQPGREAEEREERLGVQEVGDPGDPAP
ncbi:STAS domain-containing protein [Kitasatospora sp. MY 5-36]|uniref:STAS domain-containing protein n=1 Tax=unclassified Kitasatospora TaxID=2633591 RepID=UPI000670DADA|nr:STAS domain-containing protein [Kitasatospora sp. MY 5-36]